MISGVEPAGSLGPLSVYLRLRVSGMGEPMSSKARRWTGVGSLSLAKVVPAMVMVLRVSVARWLVSSRKLCRAWPSGLA